MNLLDKEVVLLAVNDSTETGTDDTNDGTHWSLLVYSKQAREFFHLDSLSGRNSDHASLLSRRLHAYLTRETKQDFPLRVNEVPVLQQGNGYDCGVHVLCNAEHCARHFMLYGRANGLEMLDQATVKGMRARIPALAQELSQAKL